MIDPASSILDQPRDLALKDGAVTAVAEHGAIPPSSAAEVFDASGLLVLPGLVDLHAHGFRGIGPVGIDFGEYSLICTEGDLAPQDTMCRLPVTH